jgi:hypothetical protein
MRIKQKTLVAIIKGGWEESFPLGTVVSCQGSSCDIRPIGEKTPIISEQRENLFPLAENCDHDSEEVLINNLPKIIRNLVLMFRDQQKQIEEIKESERSRSRAREKAGKVMQQFQEPHE